MLNWTEVPNATYEWQRATGAGAFGSSTSAGTDLTATDATVVNATEYRFRVRGKTTAVNGPWSNIPSVTPQAADPVAPVLTGEAGDNQNTLDWDAAANAATFRVRYSIPPETTLTVFPDTAETDYVDDTAINGQSRIYTVRGISASGVLGSDFQRGRAAVAAEAAETPSVVGYAAVRGVTGGTGGTVYNVSTATAFLNALQASGPRTINITGSANLNLNGAGVLAAR